MCPVQPAIKLLINIITYFMKHDYYLNTTNRITYDRQVLLHYYETPLELLAIFFYAHLDLDGQVEEEINWNIITSWKCLSSNDLKK